MVTLPTADLSGIAVAGPWTAAPPSINGDLESRVLWVHGWIAIDGVVRARGDIASFSPEDADLYVLVDGKHAPPALPATSKLQRLVDGNWGPARPSEGGEFEAVAPRVHGLTIAAALRGWKSARYTVDVRRNPERDHAELWLERAPRIRGVIRSSEGFPVENLSISAISLLTVAPEDASPDQMRLLKPEGGVTYGLDRMNGKARAKFITGAMTDKHGRFELSVPVTGDVLVVAFPFGHRPVYHELGVPGSDDLEIEVVAEKVHRSALVRLLAGGKPFEGGELLITDLSLKDGDAQPGVYVKVTADSRVCTDWLIPGRR
ncbi:MAG: hypothetical protein L6Q95_07225, partial [Planctomycetes bacterium]|nr:hypothetical protein [Planctomycetota bacterium]